VANWAVFSKARRRKWHETNKAVCLGVRSCRWRKEGRLPLARFQDSPCPNAESFAASMNYILQLKALECSESNLTFRFSPRRFCVPGIFSKRFRTDDRTSKQKMHPSLRYGWRTGHLGLWPTRRSFGYMAQKMGRDCSCAWGGAPGDASKELGPAENLNSTCLTEKMGVEFGVDGIVPVYDLFGSGGLARGTTQRYMGFRNFSRSINVLASTCFGRRGKPGVWFSKSGLCCECCCPVEICAALGLHHSVFFTGRMKLKEANVAGIDYFPRRDDPSTRRRPEATGTQGMRCARNRQLFAGRVFCREHWKFLKSDAIAYTRTGVMAAHCWCW